MAVYVDQFQTGKMSYEDMMRHYSDLINSTSEGFTSQEYLQGVLDAYDKTSVSSSLLNLDSRVEGFYADFGKYLTAANDNMAVIQSMRSTLEQIAANVAVYTEQLKKAKEEDERKAATQLTTPTKSRSSNSGGGGSVITAYGITFANEDDRNYFLSLSAEERAANVAANHTGYMWIDPTSSEFDDKDKYTIYDAKAHRSGAEGGFIGNEKSSRASDTVRTLALEPLDSDGVLAQLHLKELVLNPNQMGTLYGNMRRAVSAVAPGAAINNYAPNNTFSFGDITITEAQNVTDIAAGIMNGGLAQAITQELYKR